MASSLTYFCLQWTFFAAFRRFFRIAKAGFSVARCGESVTCAADGGCLTRAACRFSHLFRAKLAIFRAELVVFMHRIGPFLAGFVVFQYFRVRAPLTWLLDGRSSKTRMAVPSGLQPLNSS